MEATAWFETWSLFSLTEAANLFAEYDACFNISLFGRGVVAILISPQAPPASPALRIPPFPNLMVLTALLLTKTSDRALCQRTSKHLMVSKQCQSG